MSLSMAEKEACPQQRPRGVRAQLGWRCEPCAQRAGREAEEGRREGRGQRSAGHSQPREPGKGQHRGPLFVTWESGSLGLQSLCSQNLITSQ